MTEQLPLEFPCQVVEILDHGNHDYSLILKPESPTPQFKPGQYLRLSLDAGSMKGVRPDSRLFSIANSPENKQRLCITYAVKGQFTTRMEAELRSGSRVWVQMPFGDFIISDQHDVCLLAGGIGITAFTAFLSELKESFPHHVYLFYGARRPELLVYRPLVEAAKIRCPRLQVYYLTERAESIIGYLSGRIEVETVFRLVPKPLSLIYYLAGPPMMIQSLRNELNGLGLNKNQIVADAWDQL